MLAQASLDDLATLNETCTAAEIEEAIGLSREVGDPECLAWALQQLALLCLVQRRYDAVAPLAEEAAAIYLSAGSIAAVNIVRTYAVQAAIARGDLAAADALVAASRLLVATSPPLPTRSPSPMGTLLILEASLAAAHGGDAQARQRLEECVRYNAGADPDQRSPTRLIPLTHLAWAVLRQGDIAAAVAICAESLAILRGAGQSANLQPVLQLLAQAAERCGLLGHSARLSAVLSVHGSGAMSEALFGLRATQQAAVERVRAALDDGVRRGLVRGRGAVLRRGHRVRTRRRGGAARGACRCSNGPAALTRRTVHEREKGVGVDVQGELMPRRQRRAFVAQPSL